MWIRFRFVLPFWSQNKEMSNQSLQSNFSNLRFFVGENEGHVCLIVDRTVFTKKERDGIQTWRELLRWFEACLSSGESLEQDP